MGTKSLISISSSSWWPCYFSFLSPRTILFKVLFCGNCLHRKMNHFVLQQNAFLAREEMRGLSDPKEPVFCPRPRRVGILPNNPTRPLRFQMNQYSEVCDSNAGFDLDMILMKGNHGSEQCMVEVASSPPFFSGSPPSRAANPIVQDARFGDEVAPFPVLPFPPPPSGLSSPSSSARKGGCARTTFGLKPATVRVEGFDCLNRDRQNSSIPAMA